MPTQGERIEALEEQIRTMMEDNITLRESLNNANDRLTALSTPPPPTPPREVTPHLSTSLVYAQGLQPSSLK
ncbi:hypothetical protein M231_01049 [Tremella mesenterica]|uniref:Uncharacterized protein n=1 Tax=Tremella mesenterica TaxID=5217 RepID=A0A4Q1BU58_TREME|nr:hypothetical protein M231_01049 [Tremella mesenterica]